MRHYFYTSLCTQNPLLGTFRNTWQTCNHPDEQSWEVYIPLGPCLIPPLCSGLWHYKASQIYSAIESMTEWTTVSYILFYIISCITFILDKIGKKKAKHNFFFNCVITLIQGVMNPCPCKLGKITRTIRSTRTCIWVSLSHHHCECSKLFIQL